MIDRSDHHELKKSKPETHHPTTLFLTSNLHTNIITRLFSFAASAPAASAGSAAAPGAAAATEEAAAEEAEEEEESDADMGFGLFD